MRSARAQRAFASSDLDATELIGRAFKHAMAAMRRLRGRETHHPGELSYAQYSLLFSLADGCELSSRELAFAAELTPATVTQMLEHLEVSGLVARVRSPVDRRVVLTSLSDRGREVVDERRTQHEPRWRAALAQFSEEELRSAAAVIEGIASFFDERAAG